MHETNKVFAVLTVRKYSIYINVLSSISVRYLIKRGRESSSENMPKPREERFLIDSWEERVEDQVERMEEEAEIYFPEEEIIEEDVEPLGSKSYDYRTFIEEIVRKARNKEEAISDLMCILKRHEYVRRKLLEEIRPYRRLIRRYYKLLKYSRTNLTVRERIFEMLGLRGRRDIEEIISQTTRTLNRLRKLRRQEIIVASHLYRLCSSMKRNCETCSLKGLCVHILSSRKVYTRKIRGWYFRG